MTPESKKCSVGEFSYKPRIKLQDTMLNIFLERKLTALESTSLQIWLVHYILLLYA